MIIVGIAVSAVLGSVNSYLITRANVRDAISIGFWGRVTARVRWDWLLPTIGVLVVVIVCCALLSSSLRGSPGRYRAPAD
ncbi:iron chelate uptake ABC transporter family permease subunit [Rhodococcoides fascians]|uniref:iron chelate uptake ABC transporter family permease subunit n=1 Tax=Rhodococcoides fascians TaxID=1828 RepID=UPI00050CBDBD|nr:iron chelate uptake ABC transporter family permease subunit [Rhodococcus fascians]